MSTQVAAEAEGAAGSAHRSLLASTGSELVVLAAADGPLQLWNVATCSPQGLLGSHASFVTSLAASGRLVASTCSSEMRLWDLDTRSCLFQVPVGLPLPSPGACVCLCVFVCLLVCVGLQVHRCTLAMLLPRMPHPA